MHVFDKPEECKARFPSCAATVGKYDGMHLGHQRVLSKLRESARELELPAVAILSEPQPEEYFAGHEAPPRLNHFQDKVAFLRDAGIDAVYKMAFDARVSSMSAEQFIASILVDGLGVASLAVGDDFRFGRNRTGDLQLLKRQGQRKGFQVIGVPPCIHEGQRISSTLVRSCLQRGDCRRVKQLLGRCYSISGTVVEGRQLGRQLGAPTANIALAVARLPLAGIYAAQVRWRSRKLQGVASVGFNPTIEVEKSPRLEVHILDFEEDIYGECLQVAFLEKLRDELKFPDLQSLEGQIGEDIRRTRAFFGGAGAALA